MTIQRKKVLLRYQFHVLQLPFSQRVRLWRYKRWRRANKYSLYKKKREILRDYSKRFPKAHVDLLYSYKPSPRRK